MKSINILEKEIIVNKGLFNNIDVIENTLESINEAVKKKYVIRFKIQVLKDGNIILLEDEDGKRMFKLKDKIIDFTYDDLDYISPFPICKLTTVLDNFSHSKMIIVIPNIDKKNLKLILRDLEVVKNNVIIESKNIGVLKLFKKNGFIVSLLITRKNRRYLNAFFKPNIYNLELGLISNKYVKKLREDFYVIASVVKNKNDLKEFKDVYDNLVLESKGELVF